MLQLENIENAYSFHSYDQHSARLIKPDTNIHSGSSIEDNLLEVSSTTLVFQDQVFQDQVFQEQKESSGLPQTFAEFNDSCINKLLEYDAEIFLIGTGQKCQFPEQAVLRLIRQKKLPIDFMDTGAACRTFNILTSEYRKVAALIFFQ